MPDLRHHPRLPLALPAKLRLDGSLRYFTARTENLSAGGALLHLVNAGSPAPGSLGLAGNRGFRPGQRVYIGIADHPRQAMLAADRFIPATVRRSASLGHSTTLALAFDTPQRLPALAPLSTRRAA